MRVLSTVDDGGDGSPSCLADAGSSDYETRERLVR